MQRARSKEELPRHKTRDTSPLLAKDLKRGKLVRHDKYEEDLIPRRDHKSKYYETKKC